ncbi:MULTISPECIES: SpoIIE family protein phosphatase [Gammaproteobacteria]|uniref:SpoIIE family protein phosphatase n=1 Tax=Gammaproteobacteria TaxID=1236 RepID=UPI000DD039BB|nr:MULTISPECIES: SpoIIE family protein phosphatase [Gammaproteobacteria]RTE87538.1 response regulator [Aliidiomarina sp. B3213]TCZ92677.1 response regulator [Lysobacter sp. N42]
MRVLIVDDQSIIRHELGTMVAQFGYTPLTVDSGLEAIEVYPEFNPDIVLLDVIMPGLKGYEVAVELKKLAGHVHLPIIFITALDDKRSLLRGFEAGGDDFISKPFDPLILSAKLRAHMRTRSLSQSLEEKNKRLAYFNSRTEREYRIVQHIFSNALDKNLPKLNQLQSLFLPQSEFNGDVFLTACGPLGNLYLFFGDFTGHGLAAAIGTLPTSQTFFTMASRGSSITEIVSELNKRLQQLLPEDMFCAAVVMELSASGERISYWNGGMTPPALIDPDGGLHNYLTPQHVALGILENEQFDSGITSFAVELGSKVILTTDGLTEFVEPSGKMMGMDGVINLLERHSYSFDKIKEDICDRLENHQQKDDITLAVLDCVPTQLNVSHTPEALSTMPFELRVHLNVEQIRSHDPVTRILRAFKAVEGFRAHATAIFTLMSEVYVNAIDHGLLGMDSSLKNSYEGFEKYYLEREKRLDNLREGHVEINVNYVPEDKKIYFEVTDSGEGLTSLQQNEAIEFSELSYGRGLSLIKELAANVEWLNEGKTIRVSYDLARSTTG